MFSLTSVLSSCVVFSYSDSDQESDLMAAVGQLSQRLAKQREELDQLRVEQQSMFQSLQLKLDAMTSAIASAQRSSLAEHAREQRILKYIPDCKLCCSVS